MVTEDAIFRALADPTRRAIFERVTQGEVTVKELTGAFPVSQPAISQHLGTLRRAGLVRERHQGRYAYYGAEPEGLRPLVTWIEHYQAFWVERLHRLKALLEEMEE